MDEMEWRTGIRKLGLTAKKAALLMYYEADEVVNLDDIYSQFKRYGRLSKQGTISWRLFFKYIAKVRHEQAA